MYTSYLRTVSISILALGAVLLGALPNLHADPLLSVSASASPNTVSEVDTTYTLTFTPATALSTGYKIRIELPFEYNTSLLAIDDAEVSVSGANITGSTETIDTGLNVIESTLTITGTQSTQVTVTIGDGVGAGDDLTNPSSPGLYGINIDTYDGSDNLLDNGIGFVEIDDTVPVSASVTESLIMTLSNSSLSYILDPSANNGQDKSKTTTINVVTNASSGYNILGKLDDGTGNPRLSTGTDYVNSYSNASAPSNDNYFGYTARNDGTGSTADAEHAFSATSTIMTADGVNNLGLGTSTAGQDHTVVYDMNIDFLTPPGTYAGTITYTVSATF